MTAPLQRLAVDAAAWEPFPEFGGRLARLHGSEDGTVLAATYRLSGRHTWTLDYDDYFYVVAGHASVSVDALDPVEVTVGDFCRLTRGSTVTFDMSDDFHEVSVLVAPAPFDIADH